MITTKSEERFPANRNKGVLKSSSSLLLSMLMLLKEFLHLSQNITTLSVSKECLKVLFLPKIQRKVFDIILMYLCIVLAPHQLA